MKISTFSTCKCLAVCIWKWSLLTNTSISYRTINCATFALNNYKCLTYFWEKGFHMTEATVQILYIHDPNYTLNIFYIYHIWPYKWTVFYKVKMLACVHIAYVCMIFRKSIIYVEMWTGHTEICRSPPKLIRLTYTYLYNLIWLTYTYLSIYILN